MKPKGSLLLLGLLALCWTPAPAQVLPTSKMADGLRQALELSAQTASRQLSAPNGFLDNASIKIRMPPGTEKVERTLRDLGMGAQVDQAVASMNHAAEHAAASAAPLFLDAIRNMSITDALKILKGSDTAATAYLRQTSAVQLERAFKPVIDTSLEKTDATRYWSQVFRAYNQIPFVRQINPDLTTYVTQQAISGLFYAMGQQEAKIRKDPAARVTGLLQSVFGKAGPNTRNHLP